MAAIGQDECAAPSPPPDGMASDPPPSRPPPPLPMDCCESSCERCVFDRYADELTLYQAALAAWHARHLDRDPPDAG